MEPQREDESKALEPGAEPKRRRFRIVKLEERIAPDKGGGGTHNTCGAVCSASCVCGTITNCFGTCGCGPTGHNNCGY
jgi:hypothetical protein